MLVVRKESLMEPTICTPCLLSTLIISKQNLSRRRRLYPSLYSLVKGKDPFWLNLSLIFGDMVIVALRLSLGHRKVIRRFIEADRIFLTIQDCTRITF